MNSIAVVTTSYPSDSDDAAGHFVRADVRQLARDGHPVTVIAPRATRSQPPFDERVIGVAHAAAFGTPGALARLRWRPDRWLGAFSFVVAARRSLFAQGPLDAVVAHFLLPSYWPIAHGHPALSRVVVHGSDQRLFERVPEILRAQVVASLKKDQPSIQFASHELLERFARLTRGALNHLCNVTPPLLDLPPLRNKAQLRQQLGVSEPTLIVIVARLVASKRVALAIRAAMHVPRARIVVCGMGPEYRALRRAFPSVNFTGQLRRQQALEWIAAADLLLSASRQEGAPSVVREARALGVPVVATAAGDLLKWAEADPGLRVVP